MKFSLVSLSCARFLYSARPVLVSHHEYANATSTGEDGDCQGSPAASDRVNRCKQPKNGIWDQLLCRGCRSWCIGECNSHPWCKIPCCDPDVPTPHDMCSCTPRGKRYVINADNHWVVGLNTAEKCCGRDKARTPTIDKHDPTLCGCAEVGAEVHYGGHGSRDCCSGKADDNNWCLARDYCAKKGESGKCCRTIDDYTHPDNQPYTPKCGCFHAGAIPNPNDVVGYDNCCSGQANPDGNGCACIADENMKLPEGAVAEDCCSGKLTDDKEHCKAATCTENGDVKGTHGSYCCSGKDGGENKCACVPPGEKLGDEGSARHCCSGKADENKVCQMLFKGEAAPNGTDPKLVCNSGKVDADHMCRCVPKGGISDNATDCCSGAHARDNMCGCVPPHGALEYGAGEGACCTKTAVEGHCTCGVPGSPVLGMMSPDRDCCAKDTAKGAKFCGCVGPDATHNMSWEESEFCCGGSRQFDGEKCSCVQNGQAVGGWGHEEACCSGHTVEKDGARVCATIAGVYSVSYGGIERDATVTLGCDDSWIHSGDGGTEDRLHYEHLKNKCLSRDGGHSDHATFWVPYIQGSGKFECLHKHDDGELIGDHYDFVNDKPKYYAEVVYKLIEQTKC